jgi:amino acid adenylation domain-containing protein/thioester reductase-like protein
MPVIAGRPVRHGPFLTVSQLIARQAARTPDAVAVCYRDSTLTYRQFDQLANAWAAQLVAGGVRRGDVVPVVVGNSLELPVSMLALLKLGAAFVPCDAAWPERRLATVLDLLAPPLVISRVAELAHGWPWQDPDVSLLTPTERAPKTRLTPDDLAYGVFTSGSTGTPKCALNTQRGLANRFRFMSRYFRARGDEVVLQNSRHTFDSAIWQLLWPLTTGGRTVVPEQGEFLDLERIVATIGAHGVTVTDFVPATLAMMVSVLEADPSQLRRIASLRHIVVGGEAITPRAVHRLRELLPGLIVSNGYGPSEASIGMVFHRIDAGDGDHIPLGRPIDNCYAVVADEGLRPLPAGEIGEIVIGGACLGVRYLNDAAATAAAFVPNTVAGIPGDRLYRTGDLGWFDEDGLLRFAGRRDRQVKVDGIRVELGEVEAAAERCPGVRQARALSVRLGDGTALLLAAAAEPWLDADQLRTHLATMLPRTSLPRRCLVMPALPLTDNGKVDVDALRRLAEQPVAHPAGPPPIPDGSSAGASRSELSREVVRRALGDALGTDLPADADFLAHGGDSLRAMAAVLALREQVGAPVTVADIYTARTARALTTLLAARRGDGAIEVDESTRVRHDALLGADLRPLLGTGTPPDAPCAVLVTGATGFVGSRVVAELLRATDTRVYCLVRADDTARARARVVATLRAQRLWRDADGPRLTCLAGDLGRHRFGLDDGDWQRIAADCDAVLHLGALVNLVFDYEAHQRANVAGTIEVLRLLATGRPKALHHISTLGVLERHAADTAGVPVREEIDLDRVPLPGSGYSRSKWVAEQIVTRAGAHGATVTVHRLGEIMPAADNGVPNNRAVTHLLMTAFAALRTRPATPLRSDYTPVDTVARRLVAALADPTLRGRALHQFRPGSVDHADVLARAGQPLRTVPAAEFAAAVRAAAGHGAVEIDLLAGLLARAQRAAGSAEAALRSLLTDNPALFDAANGSAFARRHGLPDAEPLDDAFDAYAGWLTARRLAAHG